MTSFKFPPPPPPPPKPSPANGQSLPTNQRGGHTGGFVDRGRGRGAHQNRGSGFHSSNGGARVGHGQGNPRGHARGRGGGHRGGQQHSRGGGHQISAPYSDRNTHPLPLPSSPTVKAYVNPAFVDTPHSQSTSQPQLDPNALAQVMSFMSTPAGVQSMAAFASHMTNVSSVAPSHAPGTSDIHSTRAADSTPSPQAGQKRKLNGRNKPQIQQPSTKPPRVKAAVAPPVPSFGFTLPSTPAIRPAKPTPPRDRHDAKKRKLNLGLTNDDAPEEGSEEEEEEDVDEEAKYAQKLKGGGFIFEHGGEQISIQTGAEVAAWIKDRRRNFPTQERIVEKAKQAAVKRHDELEFLRRIQGKPSQSLQTDMETSARRPRRVQDKMQEKNGKHEELATLRKKLHESMTKKQAPPRAVNLGLGYESDTESDDDSSVLSDSSVVSSSEESSDESGPEAGAESGVEEEAPEASSSKVGPAPIKIPPPPAPVKTHPEASKKRICSSWAEHGRCRFSNKCKFEHPPKVEARVSLYDRMVEQELVKVDELALEAIKFLGQNGFLG